MPVHELFTVGSLDPSNLLSTLTLFYSFISGSHSPWLSVFLLFFVFFLCVIATSCAANFTCGRHGALKKIYVH